MTRLSTAPFGRLIRLRALVGIAVLMSGMVPVIAHAEDATGAADPLGDIVVTARRVDERLQDTPLSVSAVAGDTLERRSITNLTQLGTIAPNLSMTAFAGDRTAPMFNIRGQITSNSNIAIDPAVSLYMDNVYVARTAGNVTNLVDIDRVEVLRGPQGTLFGRNSTGGAVSIIGKKPTDKLEGYVQLRAGNYGLIEGTGVLNLPLGVDGVALRLVGQHSARDGYDRGYNGKRLNDDNSTYLRGTLKIAPQGSRFSGTIIGDYTRFDGAAQATKFIYANPAGLPAPLNNLSRALANLCSNGLATSTGCAVTPANDSLDNYAGGSIHDGASATPQGPFQTNDRYNDLYSRVTAWGVALNLEYDLGSATAKSITAWRHMNRDQSSDLDGTPYALLAAAQIGYQNQFSQELQLFGKTLGDRLDYTLGGFYFVEHGFENSATINIFPFAGRNATISHVDGTAANKSHALYGQLVYALAPSLKVTLGARHTWERRGLEILRISENAFTGARSCLFDSSVPLDTGVFCQASPSAKFRYWSYSAGLDYKISPDILAYVRTDRATRAGGFNRGPTNIAGLVPYRPEQVTNYEAGIKADLFDRRLRANLSVFRMDMKDIQRNVTQVITLPSGLPGSITQTVNAAKGRVHGLELELTARPVERLTLNGSLGLLKTRYLEFDDLNTSVSPAVVVSRAGEDFPLTPRVTATAGASYTVPIRSGSVDFSLDYTYSGRTLASASYPLSPYSTIPHYGLLNGRIGVRLDNGLEFAIWGANILDKEYFARTLDLTTNSLGFISGFPGTPRTYGGTVTWRFGR